MSPLSHIRKALNRFVYHNAPAIVSTGRTISLLAWIASIVCVVCLVLHFGYKHSAAELRNLATVYRIVQGVFLLQIFYYLLFSRQMHDRRKPLVKWIVDVAMLLTLIPSIWPHNDAVWHWGVMNMLRSATYFNLALLAFSAVMFSYGLMYGMNRHTNPSLLLSGSFLVFILLGSLMLMLPNCTYYPMTYVDALFVSTSAVCITGLSPIDVSAQLTPMGVLVLAALIQIGALGVMTFTSFFALFFSGNQSIYSQLMLRDVIYSKSMNALLPTLFYILGFTLAIEAVGALLIWLSVRGTLGLTPHEEVVFALFHSLSSFCNAGFSTLPQGMANPMLLYGNISIYWITTLLVVAGGIGFPILVNFKDALAARFRRLWQRLRHHRLDNRNTYLFNMNTRIVLATYAILFVVGAALFLWWEYDNTLAGMTLPQKITQAVFNSSTPRSSGFVSVDPSRFLNVTLVMVLFMMWVGGGSQSTAGGIKVNTFAAIVLNLRSIVLGRPNVVAFRRSIATSSIRRANCVVTLSIISYLLYSVTLLLLEPQMGAKPLLFEVASALFTVGSSLGITAQLSGVSKIVLCSAMFLGRVGIISLLTGIVNSKHTPSAYYPTDNIIIN